VTKLKIRQTSPLVLTFAWEAHLQRGLRDSTRAHLPPVVRITSDSEHHGCNRCYAGPTLASHVPD